MKHNIIITSILFFATCCWLFTGYFDYIPRYHEQHTPLYLYSTTWLATYATAPGGIASWISSFVSQFIIHSISGAISLGVLFTGILALTNGMNRKVFGIKDYFSLALIPVIYLLIRFFRIEFLPLNIVVVVLNCLASLLWLYSSRFGIKTSIISGFAK